ncbi:hypothetical protein [Treponema sp.]|uniref:hypothetical protein n=1 Tax=Treponema sp. TaxID=166 RepID=UPI00388E448B
MTSSVQIIKNQLPQTLQSNAVLRDGSVVAGRVLSQNGNGYYTVSLAGQMIEVRSQVPLQKGQVFQAQVRMSDNQLFLSIVSDSKNTGEILQKFSLQNQKIPVQLQNFLLALGFEPDSDSFKILQFMQQLGIKIDVESAKKALNYAKKNGTVNHEKAQFSFLFEEKGLALNDEWVSALLENGKRDEQNNKQQHNHDDNEDNLFFNDKISVNFVKNLKSYFESVDSASLSHKIGILSAFNTVLYKNKENTPLNHWILLPFEWNFKNYVGNIRLLFDSELKNLQKAVIDIKNSVNYHKFMLAFEKNQLSSVKYASSISKKNLLENMFFSNFNRIINVEQVDFNSLCGFCSEDEIFNQIQGVI